MVDASSWLPTLRPLWVYIMYSAEAAVEVDVLSDRESKRFDFGYASVLATMVLLIMVAACMA